MKTRIIKWGNSQGVRLPKLILESVNLSDDDAVEVTTEGGCIIIKKAEKRTIQDRFEGFDGEYESVKIDWGEPRGREIW